MVFEDLEPVIGYHFKFYLVVLVSLVWSLDRVTQVVMDGLFHPFHFVEKKSNPEHARENCKVLRIRREGEFFAIPTVFALEDSI